MEKSKIFMILEFLAKIWSILSLVFILVFFLGYGFGSDKGQIPISEIVNFIFFPIGLFIGLVLAWKFKLTGGLIAVVSMIMFHLIMFIRSGNPDFVLMLELLAVPGLIFLILGIAEKAKK